MPTQTIHGRAQNFRLLIGGALHDGAAEFEVINPATGEAFAKAPSASQAQLDTAMAAARAAQPAWAALSEEERRAHLEKFASAVLDHKAELAEIFTLEQGQSLAYANTEVDVAALVVQALAAVEIAPELIFDGGDGSRRELHYRPLGVVAAITPWNGPIIMAAAKIAEGLQPGNTMVLKPSPYTPLGTLKLGEIAAQSFPPGVLNILSGGDELGAWITEHAEVDMVTFTGSTATGKKIGAVASTNGLKRVILELGGNDAGIVLADANVDKIAPRIFKAAFLNAGQACMALKRLYVHESLFADLRDALVKIARETKVGDGFEAGVTLGPVQNRMQFDRVVDLIEDARRSGADLPAGDYRLDRAGYFIAPTIVTGVSDGVRLVDEEQFGPVLPMMPFSDVEDAINRANNSRYGLSGSIWTSDRNLGTRLAMRLEVGTAWVNKHLEAALDAPFGGAKESGIGRTMSALGAKAYMEPQVVDVG